MYKRVIPLHKKQKTKKWSAALPYTNKESCTKKEPAQVVPMLKLYLSKSITKALNLEGFRDFWSWWLFPLFRPLN